MVMENDSNLTVCVDKIGRAALPTSVTVTGSKSYSQIYLS